MNKESEVRTMQDKTRQLVDQDVYSCVSMMVDFILSTEHYEMGENAPFSMEDVTNMHSPDYSEMEEGELDEINDDQHGEDFTDYDFDEKVEFLQDNHEMPEIYEWWMVSNWLADKLDEMGECILDGNIWGRCTTGQAIMMDGIIEKLIVDLDW